MRKVLLLILSVLSAIGANALEITFKDTAYSALDKEATYGMEEDIPKDKGNHINLAFQFLQDILHEESNHRYVTTSMPERTFFRQKLDLLLSGRMPGRTNVYAILSFGTKESTKTQAKLFLTNLELEHFLGKHSKFRIGRLINTISESAFFGRVALEEESAHTYWQKIYVNDALEFDWNMSEFGGPHFCIGFKPRYKPINLAQVYSGFIERFGNGMSLMAMMSVMRQFDTDIKPLVPDMKDHINECFTYEVEVAHKSPTHTVFLNAGGYVNSLGVAPHTSNSNDFMTMLKPIVTDKDKSFRETFTLSAGGKLMPMKINPSRIKHFAHIGLEAEGLGLMDDRYTALNVNAYCTFALTRNLFLTYSVVPQFIWQDMNNELPNYICGVTNFLRLWIVVGAPNRTI